MEKAKSTKQKQKEMLERNLSDDWVFDALTGKVIHRKELEMRLKLIKELIFDY